MLKRTKTALIKNVNRTKTSKLNIYAKQLQQT